MFVTHYAPKKDLVTYILWILYYWSDSFKCMWHCKIDLWPCDPKINMYGCV